ncbi:serine hydrolase domain-containing protein [Bradyrhizobium sp. USDA 4502]
MKTIALVLLASMTAALGGEATAEARGPNFRPDGQDADAYGRRDGYPACSNYDYATKQRCRVGAFSHFDTLFPTRTIAAPKVPSRLMRAPAEPIIRYSYLGQTLTLDDYLEHHPITGFLIAKGDTILLERYQYARTDKHRMTSFSMAKTITAMLVGIAVKDGVIRSIYDTAETYVPELKGSEYGRTPIKALLQMSSGVAWKEETTNLTDPKSDSAILSRSTVGQGPGGVIAGLKHFNTREAPPNVRWNYSSAETAVLGLVVAGATGRSLSDYAREKLWVPLGAEADAKWSLDATGREVAYAYFNATLRDWARLGLMLAHDGKWNDKAIVPEKWLLTGTTIAPTDTHLSFSNSYWAGYGYQMWLIPGNNRMFAFQGFRGQFVMIDPENKLVLVQTGARFANDYAADRELIAIFQAASAQLR